MSDIMPMLGHPPCSTCDKFEYPLFECDGLGFCLSVQAKQSLVHPRGFRTLNSKGCSFHSAYDVHDEIISLEIYSPITNVELPPKSRPPQHKTNASLGRVLIFGTYTFSHLVRTLTLAALAVWLIIEKQFAEAAIVASLVQGLNYLFK